MSTVLTIYNKKAFKRYLLPAINDADTTVLIPAVMFQLPIDIEMHLEVRDHKWNFQPDWEYRILRRDGSVCHGETIKDGDVFHLFVEDKHALTISVSQKESHFAVLEKYEWREKVSVITIGSDDGNDIYYASPVLAKLHGKIIHGEEQSYYEDLGSENGSFVNGLRVAGPMPLSFGDCIDLYGLRIVYLGFALAVSTSNPLVNVREKCLVKVGRLEEEVSAQQKKKVKKTFHRSPKHIPQIDAEAVSIDEPPQPGGASDTSLFMTIAPSLTMVLPMILGCVLMAYSSRTNGSGVYMFTGLVTSVSSAVIGAVWAMVNFKSSKRKAEQAETLRNEKYRKYIHSKDEQIKEKYRKNAEVMKELYAPVDICSAYDEKSKKLWNRNAGQAGVLSHRIGIGDVPFQAEIKIPVERFTMVEDELATLPAKIKNNYKMLHKVPFCIDLLHDRLIGVVGGKGMRGAVDVALILVGQIAANHSYTDVKLVFIYDEKETEIAESFKFAKWLPHVWNETKTFRYIASNKEEASEVFYELTQKFRKISEESTSIQGTDREDYVAKPYYVVIMAAAQALEGETISKYILEPEPRYGVSTIYLAERWEDLPNECEFVIEKSAEFQGTYRMTDSSDERQPVIFDPVSPELLHRMAVNLADIEVREVEVGGDIPQSLTFLEMHGVSRVEQLNVLDKWKKNRNYDSMKALIGEKAGGAKCYLDVHEKYHGPHGLVAGTTGSGKSETLQTFILSLAISFSPDDVGFFIIDYKGGGMGNLFADLPHMLGQISNLSGNQIRRALVSIKSEKDRRQRIFKEYSVNNINSYTKLYKNGEAKIPVPHMFIVIDEFAEMKRDEPDFIKELVSVSQVGRSLGIHLIMATQKPAGTVDDNIWSNSRFKLCLRVQDRQDSVDMLHRADAAYIIQAGHCYIQVGNDELFELFQSGYSGAPYSEEEDDFKTDVAKMLSVNGIPALEGNLAKIEKKQERKRHWIASLIGLVKEMSEKLDQDRMQNSISGDDGGDLRRTELVDAIFLAIEQRKMDYPRNEYNERALMTLMDLVDQCGEDAGTIISAADMGNRKLPEMAEKTQLDAVIEHLNQIAHENGYNRGSALFLPLLKTNIHLSMPVFSRLESGFDGKDWPMHGGEFSLVVPMGLYDDPENQDQDIYVLNLAKSGHVVLCGSVATGKSTFLQTMIYGLFKRYSPEEVQAYMIDFSAKMLMSFEKAPHVGGIMYEGDREKIAKFFMLMRRILEERKQALKGGSFAQYLAVNGMGSMPAVLIVIDNYSAFAAKSGMTEEMEEFLMTLVKEGLSCGIFLVVTAGGFGSGELPGRMAENFRTSISLEMNDAISYADILRRTRVEVHPETDVKGRGIAVVDGRVLEFQTALALDAESDYARNKKIEDICAEMDSAFEGRRARLIPEIPEKPVWQDFMKLDETREMLASKNLLPYCYDAAYADVHGVDLSCVYAFAVSGVKRKGKTNALKAMALATAAKEGRVVIVDYSGALKNFAADNRMEMIADEEEWYQFLLNFRPDFLSRNKRKQEFSAMGMEEWEIFDAMQEFESVFIFIDDLPQFITTAYMAKKNENVGEYTELMEAMLDFGAFHNVYWFFAINKKEVGAVSSRRLYSLFTRDKKGLHLGGMTDDSHMNFDHLQYRVRDQALPAGRAFIPVDNEDATKEIVIPLVKGSGK